MKAITLIAITAALYLAVFMRIGPLPALGPFLNPISGFWKNTARPDGHASGLALDGLTATVTIAHDTSGIPHIYAANEHDLYFAQGYLTARDRLWQMDMNARAGAGRLAEILGPALAEYDIGVRRAGMAFAAQRRLQETMADPRTASALESYAAGVNAWIDSLDPRDFPVEYKLMGFRPEQWLPIKSANIAMSMAQTLSMFSSEYRFSATEATLGKAYIQELIKDPVRWLDTIIPSTHAWDFEPVRIPDPPEDDFEPVYAQQARKRWLETNPNNGSNNWAVHGSKTASGYPLLANDPHLNMTLPSIWHMLHLNGPEISVMGVSIPGTPGIIIGFNRDIAWGVTNAGTDILDHYQLKLDEARENYLYDGDWHPLTFRDEIIEIRGKQPKTLRIPYSHHGPVKITEAFGKRPFQAVAQRWTAHDPTNDILTWYLLNRATDYSDFTEAISNYDNPSQNFAFASREGDIALRIGGKLPVRWPGQGDAISDGTDPAYDWHGWIPKDHNPGILNPQRGFVSSANQLSADDSYPYYLGYSFAPFERGRRINDVLAELEAATIEDMQKLQLDNYSYHAAVALPFMLEQITEQADAFDDLTKLAFESLSAWDYMNEPDSIAASVFRTWWSAFQSRSWTCRTGPMARALLQPDRDQFAEAMLDGSLEKEWFDDPETDQIETVQTLLVETLVETTGQLATDFGEFGENWALFRTKRSHINHLAQLNGFGTGTLHVGGGYESVNAIGRSHGPSFRMIVELGPEIRAQGIYPGGQSGAPGYAQYVDFVDDWATGQYLPMIPYDRPEAVPGGTAPQVLFKPRSAGK